MRWLVLLLLCGCATDSHYVRAEPQDNYAPYVPRDATIYLEPKPVPPPQDHEAFRYFVPACLEDCAVVEPIPLPSREPEPQLWLHYEGP